LEEEEVFMVTINASCPVERGVELRQQRVTAEIIWRSAVDKETADHQTYAQYHTLLTSRSGSRRRNAVSVINTLIGRQ
jgi:hypothetical protein